MDWLGQIIMTRTIMIHNDMIQIIMTQTIMIRIVMTQINVI